MELLRQLYLDHGRVHKVSEVLESVLLLAHRGHGSSDGPENESHDQCANDDGQAEEDALVDVGRGHLIANDKKQTIVKHHRELQALLNVVEIGKLVVKVFRRQPAVPLRDELVNDAADPVHDEEQQRQHLEYLEADFQVLSHFHEGDDPAQSQQPHQLQ